MDVFVVEMLINMMSSLKLAHADNKSLGTVNTVASGYDKPHVYSCYRNPGTDLPSHWSHCSHHLC